MVVFFVGGFCISGLEFLLRCCLLTNNCTKVNPYLLLKLPTKEKFINSTSPPLLCLLTNNLTEAEPD